MIDKQIKDTFIKVFNLSEKKFNENLSSKNFKKWDSLNHIKLIVNLEKKLKKKVSTGKIPELNSVKKIKNFFKK